MIICSEKQKTTLVLFAQDYTLVIISEKMGVCLTTTRNRLKMLAKNHSREFDKALSIRQVYKNDRGAIKRAVCFTDLDTNNTDTDCSSIENISHITKRTF